MSPLELDVDRMRKLTRIEFLVVHTQGSPSGADSSAAVIDRYHRSLGWAGIGYHRVIRKSGTIEEGRPLIYQGAHVEGLNHRSLGVVCTGNGDLEDFTEEQYHALGTLLAEWMQVFGVPLGCVIGHYEVNQLPGVPMTTKKCPGLFPSMRRVRDLVLRDLMNHWPAPSVVAYPRRPPSPPLPYPEPFV